MRSNHPWLCMQFLISTVCGIYGRQEKLLFTTAHTMKEINMNTGIVKELVYLGTTVYSIAYDVKRHYVYASRNGYNSIVRFPYPNDQTVHFESVISTVRPFSIAFDSVNSRLYWTQNLPEGRIWRCTSDGTDLTAIVKATNPISLTLDTHNRWIYYSEYAKNGLRRVTYNGDEKVIISLAGSMIDMQVDFFDKRIYWMGLMTGDLKSAFYNGSDVKTVVSTSDPDNREISIGEDFVFYTSLTKILKIHKSPGQMPAIVHTGSSTIYGLLFYKQDGDHL